MENNIWGLLSSAKLSLCGIFAVTVTCISNLVGTSSPAFVFLLYAMCIDYLTGLTVAGVFHNSKKTKNGKLESRAGLKGLFRKGGILLVVYLAVRIDLLIDLEYTSEMVVFFFIANETISILENLGLMGIPYPEFMKRGLEALCKKEKESDYNDN